jgi:hypothetical protein
MPRTQCRTRHVPDGPSPRTRNWMGRPSPECRSRPTFDRSPVRESRTPGSARGAGGNSRSYRDQRCWKHPGMLAPARCQSATPEGFPAGPALRLRGSTARLIALVGRSGRAAGAELLRCQPQLGGRAARNLGAKYGPGFHLPGGQRSKGASTLGVGVVDMSRAAQDGPAMGYLNTELDRIDAVGTLVTCPGEACPRHVHDVAFRRRTAGA